MTCNKRWAGRHFAGPLDQMDLNMTADSKNMMPAPAATQGEGKRAYVKPEFRHEQVFETMALACGKVDDTQAPCLGVGSAS